MPDQSDDEEPRKRRSGRYNSSLTRVRPFFRALFTSGRPSEDWLREVISVSPNHDRLSAHVSEHPGTVDAVLMTPREITNGEQLEPAFEFPVRAPMAFLRFLLTHPERMVWPIVRGERRPFGSELTRRYREALIDGPAAARDEAMRLGLERLEHKGTRGTRSEPAWWVFEGETKVDCCLMTEKLVLFVEGKRTEMLSESTDWFPDRNQLVRNLEAVGEIAGDRAAAVLLAGEELLPELAHEAYERSLPHLDESQQADVRSRYLGQTTWRDLCGATSVPFDSLPDTWCDDDDAGEPPAQP